eukprot:CAMPEP_0201579296 /NCGR_PEP_ID=MMETSP0190_2-20130828/26788_1 /ASSEMBLY_ACC=CAM_ASM_000263 /TAXON_ID=37353 /ORGANISM="Rosalina sp." /LENGTH=488 /DNA_ID=CAMNT_0048013581 /DNA_START=1354 /DNA_END=2820 /DNA_ORIENTATION=+
MVISEMKDTFATIAGLDSIDHSASMGIKASESVNIDIPPKPKMLRHSVSDPRYGQGQKNQKSRKLMDRARMKRIEQTLNEDLNMNPNVKSLSNAATRGSSTNPETLSQHSKITEDSDVKAKVNQHKPKQPSSKPFKYNSRQPIDSPTVDGGQRITDARGVPTDFSLGKHRSKTHPSNSKHRVNQSHPLLMANQSLTVSTRHGYNTSNDTTHQNDIVNSSSSSETSDDTQQSSSTDNDDNSSQSSSSETSDDTECDCHCDDDTLTTTTTATTRTTTLNDLAPLSVVVSDINSIHLPPPPIARSKSSPTGSKTRHHRSRRIKKQFSIAKSPKMDDIPEEQDLEMTPEPSTQHNTTTTRSLKLQPTLFSNDSKYSKYSADTEGTNLSETDDDCNKYHTHSQQYQTMVFHHDAHSSTETSTAASITSTANISDVDIDNLHRKIQTMNRKLQQTHSNATGSTLNDYTTYTDTMTRSTHTSVTSETSNTSYSSD